MSQDKLYLPFLSRPSCTWRVRLVGSVDRSYDCFATRCGLIVLVAWEMTNLDKESAVVLSRANTLQHNLECRHAPFRPLLGVRVGRLKVTG